MTGVFASKMKSIHITNYYHKNSGGISTAYNKLLEAANRRGRYVRLIVPGERTEIEDVGDFGRIYYVKCRYSPVFDKRYRVMMPWNTYILDKSPIKKILREEQPDLIEIGEKYTLSLMAGLIRTGIMSVSMNRPMLVHLSCERMDDNIRAFVSAGRMSKQFSRGFIRNYVFPMFDFHVTNSDYTAGELLDAVSSDDKSTKNNRFLNFCWRLLHAPKTPVGERVFVNQCGVDNETFTISRQNSETRRQILQEYGLPENSKLLLYAGRISPEKNIALLPELMEILASDSRNDYRLLIAGSGPKAGWLSDECKKYEKECFLIMLGHLTDKEKLANLFANCDAFVHPNPREPFGIAPLEAMASGLPVVAPNSGGVLSYANSKNAWLAEPTAKAFADAINDIFSGDGQREGKIARGLETSAEYTWESSTDTIFALYDKMYSEFSRNRSLYDYDNEPKVFDFAREFRSNS